MAHGNEMRFCGSSKALRFIYLFIMVGREILFVLLSFLFPAWFSWTFSHSINKGGKGPLAGSGSGSEGRRPPRHHSRPNGNILRDQRVCATWLVVRHRFEMISIYHSNDARCARINWINGKKIKRRRRNMIGGRREMSIWRPKGPIFAFGPALRPMVWPRMKSSSWARLLGHMSHCHLKRRRFLSTRRQPHRPNWDRSQGEQQITSKLERNRTPRETSWWKNSTLQWSFGIAAIKSQNN